MNDFTKEELEDIICALDLWNSNHICSSMKKVQLKIQSMIEKYCEHEWRKGVHLFNDIYCTKCNKHFPVTNNE